MTNQNLNVSFVRKYRKADTTLMFVFEVKGPQNLVDQYVADKSAEAAAAGRTFSVKDDKTGKVLFWSKRMIPDGTALVKTEKGSYVTDTTELDKFASYTEQYGIEVAKTLMKQPENADIQTEG